MLPLPPRLFVALLARAGVSQAAFARLTGLSARQVNAWCRSRAAVPAWAAALAVLLEHHSPESINMMIEEAATEIPNAPGPLQWEEDILPSPVTSEAQPGALTVQRPKPRREV